MVLKPKTKYINFDKYGPNLCFNSHIEDFGKEFTFGFYFLNVKTSYRFENRNDNLVCANFSRKVVFQGWEEASKFLKFNKLIDVKKLLYHNHYMWQDSTQNGQHKMVFHDYEKNGRNVLTGGMETATGSKTCKTVHEEKRVSSHGSQKKKKCAFFLPTHRFFFWKIT